MGMERQKTPPPVYPTKPVTTWGAIDVSRGSGLGSCAATGLPRAGSAAGLANVAAAAETWRRCVTTCGPLAPRGPVAVTTLTTATKVFTSPAHDQAAGLTTMSSWGLPLSPVTPAHAAPQLMPQPSESSSGPNGAIAGQLPLQPHAAMAGAAAVAVAGVPAAGGTTAAASPERRPGKRPIGAGGRWESWDAWVTKRQRAAHQEPESLRSLLACALSGPPSANQKQPRSGNANAGPGAAVAAVPPPPPPSLQATAAGVIPLAAVAPIVAPPPAGPTAMALDPWGAMATTEDDGDECDSGTTLENLARTLRQRPQLLRLLLTCEQRLSRPFRSFGKPPTPPAQPSTGAMSSQQACTGMGPPAPRPGAPAPLIGRAAPHLDAGPGPLPPALPALVDSTDKYRQH